MAQPIFSGTSRFFFDGAATGLLELPIVAVSAPPSSNTITLVMDDSDLFNVVK